MSLFKRSGAIVFWVGVWGCVLFLVFHYAHKEFGLRSKSVSKPLQHVRSVIAATNSPDNDREAGSSLILEAENGETADGKSETKSAWTDFSFYVYSHGAARYTNAPGARLTWPISLPAGRYLMEFFVYAYETGTANVATVTIGDQSFDIHWPPSSPERRVVVRKDVNLRKQTDSLVFATKSIGQPALLLDVISIVDRGKHDAMLRTKYTAFASAIGASALLFSCALCWGSFLLRRIIVEMADPLVHLLAAIGLGLGVIGTVTTILGTCHLFFLWIVIPFLVLGFVIGAKAALTALGRWRRETHWGRRMLFSALTLPIGFMLGFALFAALAPATGVDPLIYHLAVPKWLILQTGFEYHPYQFPWAYPHTVSNLFAVGQLLFGDEGFRTAQIIHGTLGCLWIVSVYAMGKVLFGRAAGLGAAALCIAIEGFIVEMGLGLVDLGFAFFAGLTILAFIYGVIQVDRRLFYRYTLLAALMAGVAAACKVNGPTIAIAIAIAIFPAAWRRHGLRAAVASVGIIAIVSFAVVLPMYVKNYLVYYNPLYPFPTGFQNRDFSPEFVHTLTSVNTWDKYVTPLGRSVAIAWPYYWIQKEFVDPCSPGPAFLVGMLLVLANGRAWLRRFWPLLILTALLIPFWFFVSPLTRFAWPWLSILTVFACAPLSLRPLRLHRVMIPMLLIVISLGVAFDELTRSVAAINNIRGRESDRAYLARSLIIDTGPDALPPMAGISALNALYRSNELSGAVLIDTNLVAYADFPTIPVPYYLMAEALISRKWARLDGPLCLALSGKRVSDDIMTAELVDRLNVRHILFKKGMPVPPMPRDGNFYSVSTGQQLFTESDSFLRFIERWTLEGRVTKKEFADSILYSFASH